MIVTFHLATYTSQKCILKFSIFIDLSFPIIKLSNFTTEVKIKCVNFTKTKLFCANLSYDRKE